MSALRIVRAAVCSALLLTPFWPTVAAPRVPVSSPPAGYEARADVTTFVKDIVQRHPELDEEVVATTLSEARYQPQVAKFIMPAASPAAKNWKVYARVSSTRCGCAKASGSGATTKRGCNRPRLAGACRRR